VTFSLLPNGNDLEQALLRRQSAEASVQVEFAGELVMKEKSR